MLDVGDQVGSYTILERIGEGGMGVVFRAAQQPSGDQVALKVLRPELTSRPNVVRRFFNEARAVNAIDSPHIVHVTELVERSDGDPPLSFIVMELVDGRSLAEHLAQEGTLSPEQLVDLGGQVATALMDVHHAGLLHRDLKPANLLWVERDSGRLVKILDFGAAKALGADEDPDLKLTDQGTAVGTPVYMAPEQITDQELDQRTDIYSLGVVLYELATGQVPFDAKSYGDLMLQLVMDAPRPINEHLPEAPLPAVLDAVIMRCLEKEPSDRFCSMGELREALQAVLVGEAEPAPRQRTASGHIDAGARRRRSSAPESTVGVPSASVEVAPRPQRAGRWVVIAPLLLVALVGAGALLFWPRGEQQEPAAPAQPAPSGVVSKVTTPSRVVPPALAPKPQRAEAAVRPAEPVRPERRKVAVKRRARVPRARPSLPAKQPATPAKPAKKAEPASEQPDKTPRSTTAAAQPTSGEPKASPPRPKPVDKTRSKKPRRPEGKVSGWIREPKFD